MLKGCPLLSPCPIERNLCPGQKDKMGLRKGFVFWDKDVMVNLDSQLKALPLGLSVRTFPGRTNWREKTCPQRGQHLPAAAQVQRGLRREQDCAHLCFLVVCLVCFSYDYCHPSLTGIFSTLSHEWKASSAPGVLHTFSTMLVVLKRPACCTEQHADSHF